LVLSLGTPAPEPTFATTTFIVDSTLDAVDAAPGDGGCSTAGAECTLRAAIQETNALQGPDAIVLPAGMYSLTLAGFDEDASATGDLDATDSLDLIGSGAVSTAIRGVLGDRVLDIDPAGVGETVRVSGVTIEGGRLPTIGFVGSGGGIRNRGSLSLTGTVIRSGRTVPASILAFRTPAPSQ
jgi:CSLREA domain-containing protein